MKRLFPLSLLLAAAAVFAAAPALKGEVLETRSVDSYTYLRLKTGAGEIWAAVPTTSAKKGDQVTVGDPMTMENFDSKTLGKHFDKIVFGQLVDPNAPSRPAATQAPRAAAAPLAVVKVAKAAGADGKTVAEIVKGRLALKDKTVVLHAQVVKVNNGILGKNWVHLQDGSGATASQDNDILVTTQDHVAVGDVVNARGVVHLDVNLGAGYAYPVLIEDAAVRK